MEECFSLYLCFLSANDFEEGGWWIEYVQELISREIQVPEFRLLEVFCKLYTFPFLENFCGTEASNYFEFSVFENLHYMW